MNNPLEILHTLDRHLTRPVELTLFGRSALALGYPDPRPEYGATLDVDGIIPMTAPEPDKDFWLAQQATNAELKKRGLYITHLFSELDVILQPDWIQRRVFLETFSFKKLKGFRPATIDLVLTKMAVAMNKILATFDFCYNASRCRKRHSARRSPGPEFLTCQRFASCLTRPNPKFCRWPTHETKAIQ